MLNWRDTLTVDSRKALEALVDYGCHLFWREEGELRAVSTPKAQGLYSLEMWKCGRLLDFAPVRCPFDRASMDEMTELISRQQFIHQLRSRHL